MPSAPYSTKRTFSIPAIGDNEEPPRINSLLVLSIDTLSAAKCVLPGTVRAVRVCVQGQDGIRDDTHPYRRPCKQVTYFSARDIQDSLEESDNQYKLEVPRPVTDEAFLVSVTCTIELDSKEVSCSCPPMKGEKSALESCVNIPSALLNLTMEYLAPMHRTSKCHLSLKS